MSEESRKIDRRKFIKLAGLGTAGVLAVPNLIFNAIRDARADIESEKEGGALSKVVLATFQRATEENGNIVSQNVQTLLDEAIKTLTSKQTARESWEAIFSNLQFKDVIGIKVNTFLGRLWTHTPLVDAIINGLRSIGVSENNIIVWDTRTGDLKKAGFTVNASKEGVRCFGTDYDGIGYDKSFTVDVGGETHLTSILTKHCQHLINVPVLKDHRYAGVTLSLKNHFGSMPLADHSLSNALRIMRVHRNNCDPYIAQVNSVPDVKNKTRLIICDALLGQYDGGPGGAPQWLNNQLIISKDSVAADYEGVMIIEQKRRDRGLESIIEKAKHIKTASTMGLGTNDPKKIELIKLNL